METSGFHKNRGVMALLWLGNAVFWTGVGALSIWSIFAWQLSLGVRTDMRYVTIVSLVNSAIFFCLTPIVFLKSLKFPIAKGHLSFRVPGYFAGAGLFVVIHVLLRVLLYPVRGPVTGRVAPMSWPVFTTIFEKVALYSLVNDIFFVYVPVVLAAHAFLFYNRSRTRELRASQLEAKLAIAELRGLKMQLHPHFLFNAMHSISSLMHKNVHAADKMMSQLSDLLRMTLKSTASQEIPLRNELDFLRAYLEIERVRFRDRLQVVFEVGPETLDAMVPTFLLQPIVENAVRHGTARKEHNGRISISATRLPAALCLRVSDNGPGFGRTPPDGNNGGLGLKITRERLALLYGPTHKLEIVTSAETGTEVIIEVPYLTPLVGVPGPEHYAVR